MSTPPHEFAADAAGEPHQPPPASAYPAGGYVAGAGADAGAAPVDRQPGRALLTGLLGVLALAALGAPLGLLWAMVAPGVPVTQSADGPILSDPQPEQFIAADGWFSLLGLIFGVLAAGAVWWGLRRRRGMVGLVMLAFGMIGAALVAWWVGRHIGLGDYEQWRATAAVGQTYLRPPDLRAGSVHLLWGVLPSVRGDLLVPAFGAVVAYTLLAGWADDPDLNAVPARQWAPDDPYPTAAPGPGYPADAAFQPQPPEPAPGWSAPPGGPVSSDSPDRPAPTTAPAPPEPGATDRPRG